MCWQKLSFGEGSTEARFGTYRWEEHIDNPRLYGRAIDSSSCQALPVTNLLTAPDSFPVLWQEDGQGLLNFILTSQNYVKQQLDAALRSGPSLLGYEHFGNAMHTVEDFFAHSNFVELALGENGQDVDPKTGIDARSRAPIRDRLGRLRLTTGVFLPRDTVVSLEKLFLYHLRAPSSDKAQRINEVLIGRLLGSGVASTYSWLVGLWKRTPVAWVQQKIEEAVFAPLKKGISDLLHPLAEFSARFTGNEVYWGLNRGAPAQIIETSHSLVAKDDPPHPYHQLASRLAERAVQEYWRELSSAWPRQQNYIQTRFDEITRSRLNHPRANADWWRPLFPPARPGQTPPVPPPQPLPSQSGLRRGSQGSQVREVQTRLNEWLLGTPQASLPLLVADGIFGPKTEAAVAAFQRLRGMRVTGIIDLHTAASLRSVPRSGGAQPSSPPPSLPKQTPAGADGKKFTNNPNEVVTRRTTPTAREVVTMLRMEWPGLSENGARTLTAQFMGETGGGKGPLQLESRKRQGTNRQTAAHVFAQRMGGAFPGSRPDAGRSRWRPCPPRFR